MAEAGHASSAVVVWDDIERLLGVTMTSTDGSDVHLSTNSMLLESLLSSLRAPPPSGACVCVIAVTSVGPLLARTALYDAFDAVVTLPPLADADVAKEVRSTPAVCTLSDLHTY